MRLYTEPRKPKTIPVGALLMIPLFALPLGAWIIEQGIVDLGTCGMRAAVGIPCLSCGATRATLALFGGDILSALALQPLIITLYFGVALWGLASFGTFMANRKLILRFNRLEDLIFKISLIALPLANWAYLIIRDI